MADQFFNISALHGYTTSERLRGNGRIRCTVSFALLLVLVSGRLLPLLGWILLIPHLATFSYFLSVFWFLKISAFSLGRACGVFPKRFILIFFYIGLILFLLSINFPFNKTLLLIIFFIRQEIEAQVKGEGEVEDSKHEG